MKESLNTLVGLLLRKNKIPFDKEELLFQIESHPSYPSLHAITGVLDHFNIENVAAEVPVSKEILVQLPNCYIGQLKTENDTRLVIIEKKKQKYFFYHADGKKENTTEQKVLKEFTGILVAVDKNESTQTIRKPKNIKPYLWIGIMLLAVVYSLTKEANSYTSLLYLILSITGIVISIAIVKQDLGLQTAIGDAFCSGVNDKKDCDAVLASKGAEIIRGYKLSDLSILYFCMLALLTFTQIKAPYISYFISILILPITIYSIYYQYAVVKKWCFLCLTIVGVLWLQATLSFTATFFDNNYIFKVPLLSDLAYMVIIGFSSLLSWHFIKPLLSEVKDLRKEKIDSVKFKRNFELFSEMLHKAPQISTAILNSKELIFGNHEANLELVIVTNPFCGHCKPVHKQVEEILQQHGKHIRVVIRFNINTEDIEGNGVRITSRLLEIYQEEGKKECLIAMQDIYENGNAIKWIKKWGKTKHTDIYHKELVTEKEWCKENGINFTPEILVNGRTFPKEYKRSDLIFFIEDLAEQRMVTLTTAQ